MQSVLFAVPVLVASAMLVLLALRRASRLEARWGWISFVAHVISAIAMVAITEHVYEGGDMLGYARFGSMMAHRMSDDFTGVAPMALGLILHSDEPIPFAGALPGSSSGALQGIAAWLMFALGDSLYAACLLIAGFSFLAKLAIFRVLRAELPELSERLLLIACLLLPSAVFWSSGLLKEPLAVIGISMMVHGGHRLARDRRSARALAWWLSGAALTAITKAYFLPPFAIAAAVWYFLSSSRIRASRNVLLRTRYLILGVIFALSVVVAVGALIPRFAPENFAEQAVRMQEIGARTEGGSNYELAGAGTGVSVATTLLAVLTVLFRPQIFEVSNAMMLMTALEMTCLTFLFLAAVIRKRILRSIEALIDRPALAFCAVFVLTLAIGIGLTTTNLGTLSRYRAPFMPFFATLLFALGAASRRVVVTTRAAGQLEPTGRTLA